MTSRLFSDRDLSESEFTRMQSTMTWIGIAFCVTQSAMFSGSNLAFYRLSRL